MSMSRSVPHPTEWPIVRRQEEAIDRLLDLLRDERDPEQRQAVVNILAEGADVPLLALPDDPIERADQLGDAWVTAIWQAGTDHDDRLRCVRLAVGQLRELLAVISDWEREREEDELRSW